MCPTQVTRKDFSNSHTTTQSVCVNTGNWPPNLLFYAYACPAYFVLFCPVYFVAY